MLKAKFKLKSAVLLCSLTVGTSILYYTNEDFYYLMTGMKRGIYSLFTGAQIVLNYKIVIIFKLERC